jgi:HEPN domain-containing protein
MKRETREWVKKAEDDFQTVQRELRARKRPNLDGACFHAQQCIEKYLKARLQEANISFPRTHDLERLLDLAKPIEPMWEIFRRGLARLNQFSVRFRYPGNTASRANAKEALQICREIRAVIRNNLGCRP